jgi:hypothetical protein
MRVAPLNLFLRQLMTPDSFFRRVALWFVFVVAALTVFYLHFFVYPFTLRLGATVPFTVIAPQSAVWIDSEKLASLQAQMQQKGKVVVIDSNAANVMLSDLDHFFQSIDAAKKRAEPEAKAAAETAALFGIDRGTVEAVWKLPQADIESIKGEAATVLIDLAKQPLSEDRMAVMRKQRAPQIAASLSARIAYQFLRPNLVEPSSENDQGVDAVKLAKGTITKGDTVVAEGQTVTQGVIDKISALSAGFEHQNYLSLGGISLAFILFAGLWLYYLTAYKRSIFQSEETLFVVFIVFLISLVAALFIGRAPYPNAYFAISLPIIMASMFYSVLYDAMLAIYASFGLALVVSLLFNFNADLTIYNVVAGIIPPIFLYKGASRFEQVRVGYIMAGVSVAVVAIVIMTTSMRFSYEPLIVAGASGLLAVILALGLTAFFEFVSGQLTPGKLRDLLDQRSPLLNKMFMEAPGTYYHCQAMASMAEEAATRVGADPLLARVGAMYHDIGKTRHPKFFAENIHDYSLNPHSTLSPESSYQIILSHVTDGVSMAKQAKLPKQIVAFIEEHHGTGVMKYFYRVAKEMSGNGEADPNRYRYPGPKPRSKETAIVHLADVCEAIVRSKEEFGEGDIESEVARVIREKIDEDQLTESGLTLKDLSEIKSAFVQVLTALHHARVKYPDDADSEKHSDSG